MYGNCVLLQFIITIKSIKKLELNSVVDCITTMLRNSLRSKNLYLDVTLGQKKTKAEEV